MRNTEKDYPKDPLDVRELLTDSTRKAMITSDGELQIKTRNDKEKPSVELMKERYWGSREYRALLDKRLALETRAMQQRFPDFNLRRAREPFRRHSWEIAAQDELFWIGRLKTYSGACYQAAIVYPKDYPFGEIRAYILQPYIPATEHRFKDGHLCLYDHEGAGEGFDGDSSTAVTIVAWTAAWLHAYEIWRSTGKWPTLEDKQ